MTDRGLFLACISCGLNADITCYTLGLPGMISKVCLDGASRNFITTLIFNNLKQLDDLWESICDTLEIGVIFSDEQCVVLNRMLSRVNKQLNLINIVLGAKQL